MKLITAVIFLEMNAVMIASTMVHVVELKAGPMFAFL